MKSINTGSNGAIVASIDNIANISLPVFTMVSQFGITGLSQGFLGRFIYDKG